MTSAEIGQARQYVLYQVVDRNPERTMIGAAVSLPYWEDGAPPDQWSFDLRDRILSLAWVSLWLLAHWFMLVKAFGVILVSFVKPNNVAAIKVGGTMVFLTLVIVNTPVHQPSRPKNIENDSRQVGATSPSA